jgi:predicted RNA-binding protein YlxR (DUF448 family)
MLRKTAKRLCLAGMGDSMKRIPLRRCVGCGAMKSKAELLRVSKTGTGEIFPGKLSRQDGRSAYVCQSMDCITKARKTRGLERSFKMQVPGEVYESLEQELNDAARDQENIESARIGT